MNHSFSLCVAICLRFLSVFFRRPCQDVEDAWQENGWCFLWEGVWGSVVPFVRGFRGSVGSSSATMRLTPPCFFHSGQFFVLFACCSTQAARVSHNDPSTLGGPHPGPPSHEKTPKREPKNEKSPGTAGRSQEGLCDHKKIMGKRLVENKG